MISAVVLTKNEEKNIKECLYTLKWCDEVIVIDDNSEDKTVQIAKDSGAKVYTHSLNNTFSTQRNYGLDKAKGEWVLFVDADERISQNLAFEITNVISHNLENYNGFYIKRLDSMWNKILKHGESGSIKLLRLAKKEKGIWVDPVHETWKIKGRTGTLKNPIIHYPHPSLSNFLREINFYTTLRSDYLYSKKKKVYWWEIITYPKGKFIVNYFFKLGILDGIPGLINAILMSFHSYLVRAKLWLKWQLHSN